MTDRANVFEAFEAVVKLLDPFGDVDRLHVLRLIYTFYDVSVPFEPAEATRPYGEPIDLVAPERVVPLQGYVYAGPGEFPPRLERKY